MPVTPTAPRAGYQPVPQDERALGPAGPASACAQAEADEAFLSRFGDAIDDRVAEILDELLAEQSATRPHQRLLPILGLVSLTLALAASVLLRHNPLAAWTIWPSTATICLAITWTSRTGKS